MALKKTTAPTSTPAFEDQDDTVVVDRAETSGGSEAQATPEAVAEATPEVAQTASNAIEKAKSTAVATGTKYSAALQEFRNSIALSDVRSMGVGVMAKVVVDQGGFKIEKRRLGETITVQVISFNDRWQVSPGDDSDEAKEYLRTSYDNETLEGETMPAKDYVNYLKEAIGYKDASMKHYVDLWAMVVKTKDGDVPEEEQEFVQIQLSPQSVKAFTGFQVQAGVLAARTKRPVGDRLVLTKEDRSYGGKDYASIKFSVAK